MNPFVERLKAYIAENPPDYGDNDAHSILEMLYYHYNELNSIDAPEIKAAFEELYCKMTGTPIREIDKIIDTVCSLCREHEKAGFVEGVKVGIQLDQELSE